MPSIVRLAEPLPEEREMLGVNVVHAVQHDGETELDSVNRSLAVHGEEVGELAIPKNQESTSASLRLPAGKTVRAAGPSPPPFRSWPRSSRSAPPFGPSTSGASGETIRARARSSSNFATACASSGARWS